MRTISHSSVKVIVSLRNVDRRFITPSGDFFALQDLSLEIRSNELVAIVGQSGSGKSTLLNLIAGIDRPTSGEVWVADSPLHCMSESRLSGFRGRQVGIVFQFFQLLPTLTAVENVILPMDFAALVPAKERRARAQALLEQVGVADQADKLPAALSGGQQQRVAIARALANDPGLVVADEPTGNLDSRTARQVLELLTELVSLGKTVLVVTHERDVEQRFQRVVELADGKLVSDRRGGLSQNLEAAPCTA